MSKDLLDKLSHIDVAMKMRINSIETQLEELRNIQSEVADIVEELVYQQEEEVRSKLKPIDPAKCPHPVDMRRETNDSGGRHVYCSHCGQLLLFQAPSETASRG